MNDLILITISSIGGGIVGFFACAVMTAGKVADDSETISLLENSWEAADAALAESDAARSRCADALETVRGKLDAIQALANSPQTIRKKDIRAVLGEG